MTGRAGATIGALGEFGLIAAMTARLGVGRADTVVGAGPDDTAVLRLPDGRLQLATIDAQAAGVHFRPGRTSPEDIGRKAAAVNLSDIAAMGGRPTHGLAALAAPPTIEVELVLGLVDGLAGELARWGADLVGGNVSRHSGLLIDLALLGEVEPDRLLLRSGAVAGDVVLVTGDLGAAAAGAVLMGRGDSAAVLETVAEEDTAYVRRRQAAPTPRLDVAPLLAPLGATAAIDLSDGLASDVEHLCRQSGVGVRIEASRLPIAPATVAVAAALGLNPLALAAGGGEDYELLFTARPEDAEELARQVSAATGIVVTAIGEVTAGDRRVIVRPNGAESPLEGGFRHFRSRRGAAPGRARTGSSRDRGQGGGRR